MTKYIVTFILSAACILSSCHSDYYDFETETDTDGSNEELSLTVSASETVVSDGISSRADDLGSSTRFEEGDCVGLIIIDKDRRLLADNVPFRFNGTEWVFDADNNEGKQRVYYDATMSTYIVYYPYDKSVNGVKDVSTLKSQQVFAQQKNQSEELAYRFSDLMVWSHTGEALKHLAVGLEHVRNSFSLGLKLKWHLDLPSDNTLEYHPLREALIDFKVRLEDGTPILNDDIDYTYHAEDSTFRYILPDDYSGKITWRYTYRGESFGGESNVPAGVTGVRYVQDTRADISYEKMERYDYYSSKMIGDRRYGFVMPWDAEERFADYLPIGIVFQLGQHRNDRSNYTSCGIGQEKCHGYVLALTNACETAVAWAVQGTMAADSLVTSIDIKPADDWGGYLNMCRVRNYVKQQTLTDDSVFPAAFACETYVDGTGSIGALCNTSGWFVPPLGMMNFITDEKATINNSIRVLLKFFDLPDSKLLLQTDNLHEGYWTSSDWPDKPQYQYFRKLVNQTIPWNINISQNV